LLPLRASLVIDPTRRVGIALDFQVLTELLVPDGLAVSQKCLDLSQDKRVAFEGCGVVGFVKPDVLPNPVGL
jgi:hypothetical protein